MNKDEETSFYLGMNAGNVFVDNVSALIVEFISRYDGSDFNFTDEFYIEGFMKAVRNDLDIEGVVRQTVENSVDS